MTHTQVAISFDTTGSMWGALDEVRTCIVDIIRRLKRDIPGVALSVVAHGDYDTEEIYVTKPQDFSDNEIELTDFVQNVEKTGGGGPPECYELVLQLVRTKLSWRRKATKILIVIGDAYPHPPTDPQNKDNIDWKQEAKLLAEMPVRIYGVQIGNDKLSTEFFRAITQISGGSHLNLSEFSTLSDVILAICYRTSGPEHLKTLETEVRARYAPHPLHKDLESVFAVLHKPQAAPTVAARATGMYNAKDPTFFWGESLTSSKAANWNEPDDDLHLHHLILKMITLDSRADVSETHVVEVETTDINNQCVKQPLITLVGKADYSLNVDLSFNSKVTFRLSRGSGPVYLSGQHCVTAISDAGEEFERNIPSPDAFESRESSSSTSPSRESSPSPSPSRKSSPAPNPSLGDIEAEPDDVVERHLRSFTEVGTVHGITNGQHCVTAISDAGEEVEITMPSPDAFKSRKSSPSPSPIRKSSPSPSPTRKSSPSPSPTRKSSPSPSPSGGDNVAQPNHVFERSLLISFTAVGTVHGITKG